MKKIVFLVLSLFILSLGASVSAHGVMQPAQSATIVAMNEPAPQPGDPNQPPQQHKKKKPHAPAENPQPQPPIPQPQP